MEQLSMADVAAAVGTSAMSVSRALRGDPRCSEALRKRIVAEAERLGYQIDPLQSLHMTRRRIAKHGAIEKGASIAFLDMYEVGRGMEDNPSNQRFLRGAEKRAADLGLKVELFAPVREGYGMERFRKILNARGVRGMILGPMPQAHVEIEMDFSGLAVVSICQSLEKPILHRVGHNHYMATNQALEYLWNRKRRRVGIAIGSAQQERVGYRWHTAYYGFFNSRDAEMFEPFRFEWDITNWAARKEWFNPLCEWVSRNKLNVVLGIDPWIVEALVEAGYRVPDQVMYFDMDWYPKKLPSRPPCINQKFETIGAAAVDQIVGQWARYEYGVPDTAYSILLDGQILDGDGL